MTGFEDLSTEIQEIILEKCCEPYEPPLTLKNVSLVSRIWRCLAVPMLFQRVEVSAQTSETDLAIEGEMGQLAFLSSNEQVQPSIRTLAVSGLCNLEERKEWVEGMIALLPKLHRLEHIILFGRTTTTNNLPGQPIGRFAQILFQTLEKLGKRVTITLDRKKQELEAHIMDGDRLSWFIPPPMGPSQQSYVSQQLRSLRVSLAQRQEDESQPGPDRPYAPTSSIALDKLLKHCSQLSELNLMLTETDGDAFSESFEYESSAALENISVNHLQLKSLGLEGEFHISNQAWDHWGKFHWHQLESLSVTRPYLILNLSNRLVGRPLASLRSLNLNASALDGLPYPYDGCEGSGTDTDTESEYNDFYKYRVITHLPEIFLQSALTHLALKGYKESALIDYLNGGNAAGLRSVQFRGRYSSKLIYALAKCPKLSWLGIDRNHNDPDFRMKPEFSKALATLPSTLHLEIFNNRG